MHCDVFAPASGFRVHRFAPASYSGFTGLLSGTQPVDMESDCRPMLLAYNAGQRVQSCIAFIKRKGFISNASEVRGSIRAASESIRGWGSNARGGTKDRWYGCSRVIEQCDLSVAEITAVAEPDLPGHTRCISSGSTREEGAITAVHNRWL